MKVISFTKTHKVMAVLCVLLFDNFHSAYVFIKRNLLQANGDTTISQVIKQKDRFYIKHTMDVSIIERFKLDKSKDKLFDEEISLLDSMSEEDIKSLITYHDTQHNRYKAFEQALKVMLNSIYGAFGNPYFVCSTLDIAGAITAMGRDLIKYMDKMGETYAYEFWHVDEDLHNHLGVDTTQVKPIDPTWIHRESGMVHEGAITEQDIDEGVYQRRVSVCNYVDTDSLFINWEPLMESCGWKGDPQEFIMKCAKFRLEPLFKKKLEAYAKKYLVKNIQDFELENVNESVLFLQKKMYIKHTVWEDGVQYQRLKNIVPKGVHLIKKGTPKFARDKVMDIILYIFDNSKTYTLKKFLSYVKELRKQYEMVDINDIVQQTNINMYYSTKLIVEGKMVDGPGIIDDTVELKWAKATYVTVKASGLYNHLLNQNKELKVKYDYIRPGDKVKIYPCKHEKNDKFCYHMGLYPSEFAPPVDYDELFEKTVTKQVNEYMRSLGFPELNKRLSVVLPVF